MNSNNVNDINIYNLDENAFLRLVDEVAKTCNAKLIYLFQKKIDNAYIYRRNRFSFNINSDVKDSIAEILTKAIIATKDIKYIGLFYLNALIKRECEEELEAYIKTCDDKKYGNLFVRIKEKRFSSEEEYCKAIEDLVDKISKINEKDALFIYEVASSIGCKCSLKSMQKLGVTIIGTGNKTYIQCFSNTFVNDVLPIKNMNEIYDSASDVSMNSKKLYMLHTLIKDYRFSKETALQFLSNYNFQVRKVDIVNSSENNSKEDGPKKLVRGR